MRHALEETTLLKQPNRNREIIEKKYFQKMVRLFDQSISGEEGAGFRHF